MLCVPCQIQNRGEGKYFIAFSRSQQYDQNMIDQYIRNSQSVNLLKMALFNKIRDKIGLCLLDSLLLN